MRTTIALFTALLAAASVHAQAGGIASQFPCAATCINNLISDPTCNKGNGAALSPSCICTSKTLIDTVSCCIAKSCTPAEQAAPLNFAKGICGAVPGEVLPASAGCSGAASTTAATTVTNAAAVSSASPLSIATSSAASVSASASSSASAGSASSASAASASSTAVGAAVGGGGQVSPPPTSTAAGNAAAAQATGLVGGVVGMAVGLAGLLL